MDPYVGEIRLFAGNYAPIGWALCDGSVLPIYQYHALFSVIGNTYGGDAKTTFALPNLLGMAPMGQGSGPGLTPRALAAKVGEKTQTLSLDQIPSHAHAANGTRVSSNATALADPTNAIWGSESVTAAFKPYASVANVDMNALALDAVGGNSSHNNMQPFLALTFIIATEGVFPPKQ
ncbi:phage tail protein [Paenibacillaceae bacterium WGS1546]|uniref:phage tail protein n=1 Tax=Cohnella sp. WGS1546 TaxID=3366810 RepID=UPI00372D4FF3